MANEITNLIDLLNGSDDQAQEITRREFVEALRAGLKTEPDRFSLLVEALEARIKRAYPDWTEEQAIRRALSNIGVCALLADHNYETEIMLIASMGGKKTVQEWYDDPKNYGVAMNAFADYVGVKGRSIREFITD